MTIDPVWNNAYPFLPHKHKLFIFFHYCTLQTEWSIIWYQTKPNALLIKIRDSALCWINIKFTLKPPEKRNNSSLPLLSYTNAFYSHNQSRQVSYVHCLNISAFTPLSCKCCATFSENQVFFSITSLKLLYRFIIFLNIFKKST